MRLHGPGKKFRVELAADHERVIFDLGDLHQLLPHPLRLDPGFPDDPEEDQDLRLVGTEPVRQLVDLRLLRVGEPL